MLRPGLDLLLWVSEEMLPLIRCEELLPSLQNLPRRMAERSVHTKYLHWTSSAAAAVTPSATAAATAAAGSVDTGLREGLAHIRDASCSVRLAVGRLLHGRVRGIYACWPVPSSHERLVDFVLQPDHQACRATAYVCRPLRSPELPAQSV